MKIKFWTVLKVGAMVGLTANAVINTVSRIRRNRLEDENYQLEIEKKKEEKAARKAAKEAAKREQTLEVPVTKEA